MLAIYDCCFAEKNGAIHIKDVKASSSNSHIQEQIVNLSKKLSDTGLSYLQWSSARAEEVSFGGTGATTSVFTKYLIAGLKGGKECELNGADCKYCYKFRKISEIENFVMSIHLQQFISQHVKQHCEKISTSLMHPNFSGISEESFPLVVYNKVSYYNGRVYSIHLPDYHIF